MQENLKILLAKERGLQTQQVHLFNSKKEALLSLFASIKSKEFFLYVPLAHEYETLALQSKKHIYKINRLEEELAMPTEEAVVVFMNPSMPEGHEQESMQELLSKWMTLECSIILDETFLAFEQLHSMREAISSYKKLYIVESLPEFYAPNDGVSLCAIYADKKRSKKLKPHYISPLDMSFMQAKIQDEAETEQRVVQYKKYKEQLMHTLEQSQLFSEVVESDTNTILSRAKEPKSLAKKLQEQNIPTERCDAYDYLSAEWFIFFVDESSTQKISSIC